MIELEKDPYYPIADHLRQSLQQYVNHRLSPGGFLTSVLQNDLMGAAMRADMSNRLNLANIACYVKFHIPDEYRGDNIQNHLNGRQDG